MPRYERADPTQSRKLTVKREREGVEFDAGVDVAEGDGSRVEVSTTQGDGSSAGVLGESGEAPYENEEIEEYFDRRRKISTEGTVCENVRG